MLTASDVQTVGDRTAAAHKITREIFSMHNLPIRETGRYL